MTLGIIRLDLFYIEENKSNKEAYCMYIGRASCNIISYLLNQLGAKYNFKELEADMCRGLCPASILDNNQELLDLGYYNMSRDTSLTFDTIELIYKDIVQWFDEKCKTLSQSEKMEIETAENYYNNMMR